VVPVLLNNGNINVFDALPNCVVSTSNINAFGNGVGDGVNVGVGVTV
jgi:hypothetical protein